LSAPSTSYPAVEHFDAIILGAGAAGLFCAGQAAALGLRVVVLDHASKLAEKIRISGGGRANFTNLEVTHRNFTGHNPNFCRSALQRFQPRDFIALVDKAGIPWHEKHKGQLFCDRSANDLIGMLKAACDQGGVRLVHPCHIRTVSRLEEKSGSEPQQELTSSYFVDSDAGGFSAPQLVVATGGLSIPKIGASDLGLRLAKQFGLRVVEPRPALVPLTFDGSAWAAFAQLAGLSLPVRIAVLAEPANKKSWVAFDEDLLFTHRGLSGPAVLQISTFWQAGQALMIDLAPGADLRATLLQAKGFSKKRLVNVLSDAALMAQCGSASPLPARLAEAWLANLASSQPGMAAVLDRPVAEVPDKVLLQVADSLHRWSITPSGTEGYAKAEVTAGGVDTRDLSSQTMESRVPGLYFIGEVVDVTGWLGGYNFQWAWASGHACALALKATQETRANPPPAA
jgi:predicted Rossmann fold flavoprotein